MLPGRTLDINQKYDRPPPDLFNSTALLHGIHFHLMQNAQQSSGVENGLVLTGLFNCLVLTMLDILEKQSLSVVECSA